VPFAVYHEACLRRLNDTLHAQEELIIKHDASVEVNAQILNYDGRVNTIIKCMELINDEKTWQHY
jgi:hypothetical protein